MRLGIWRTLPPAVTTMRKSPALKLTPEAMEQRLNAAVEPATRELKHQVELSRVVLASATHDLQGMVVSARRGDQQNWWLLWTWLGGLVLGLLLYAVMAGPIARMAPVSWLWPERVATRVLDEPTLWDAGDRLMLAANPEGWRAIIAGADIVRNNGQAIDRCRQQSGKGKKTVRCSIEVKAVH